MCRDNGIWGFLEGHDNTRLRVECWVRLDPDIIEELSCGRSSQLKVSSLIKLSMVALFDDTYVEVKIDNILVRGHLAKAYAFEVMLIKFATTNPRNLDADPRAEYLEVAEVGAESVVGLKWRLFCSRVDESVMQIDQVEQSQ
jgi:hypothetical protein